MKLCKDCKHYQSETGLCLCKKYGIDMVDGLFLNIEARDSRDFIGTCGKTAIHFEPRD